MPLRLLTLLLVLLLLNIKSQAAEQRPNVVIVMADDIGVGDISFYKTQFLQQAPVVKTPNLDRLAENGIWFTDGHSATALCAPTRFAIMSGKNNYRSPQPWGQWDMFSKNVIANSDHTIGNVAKNAGYATGFVGKWHLGGSFFIKNSRRVFKGKSKNNLNKVDLTRMVGGGPNDLGFEYSYMLPNGIQGPTYLAYENQQWAPLHPDSQIMFISENNAYDPHMLSSKGPGMGDSHWRTEAMGDLLSQKAVDFITRQPANKPFMLYYASPMPHLPHMPP